MAWATGACSRTSPMGTKPNGTDLGLAAAYIALGGVGTPPACAAELRERLQVLRSWIHPADWATLVRAHPPAADWFDEDGLAR